MRSRIVRTALASVALVATLGLVACGDQTPATQTQDDPQEQEQVVKDPQESEQDDQTPVESQSDPADPPIATVSYEADGEEQSSEPMTCARTAPSPRLKRSGVRCAPSPASTMSPWSRKMTARAPLSRSARAEMSSIASSSWASVQAS